MALVAQEINKMGDANCPECGGGYEVEDNHPYDGDIQTATCRSCGTKFEVEAEVKVSFNMV